MVLRRVLNAREKRNTDHIVLLRNFPLSDIQAYGHTSFFSLFIVQILPPPHRWPVTLPRRVEVIGQFHRPPDSSTVSSSTR